MIADQLDRLERRPTRTQQERTRRLGGQRANLIGLAERTRRSTSGLASVIDAFPPSFLMRSHRTAIPAVVLTGACQTGSRTYRFWYTIRQEVEMATKLTLRLDERLIAAAKRQAAARGTSVSRMVAAYVEALEALEAGDLEGADAPAPSHRVRSLLGVLPSEPDPEGTYRTHLVRKHA